MPLLRIFGMLCYAALAVVILAFIFTNRTPVAVEFFPIGGSGEFPLYLVLSVVFCAGLVIGLLHSATLWLGMRGRLRRADRAIAQLEQEIAAKPPIRP